jgi:hypothetical protein
MSDALESLTDSYISAYARDEQCLTIRDIDEIVREMTERVRAMWQARVELEPRSVGLDFRPNLDQIVPMQRQKLILAMKRMEHERELAGRQPKVAASTGAAMAERIVYNISGANARVKVNSTDSSVNVVNVAPTQLFAEIRNTIQRDIDPAETKEELLRRVDELETAVGTPTFLKRYQEFVAALSDHVGLFQAFLPALAQLLS